MTEEELSQQIFELSVQAGMNQRYHQRNAGRWNRADSEVRISVGMFAVSGLSLSIASVATSSPWFGLASLVAILFTAVAGMVMNLYPFAEWERDHEVLFAQWTDIRQEVDSLQFVSKLADRTTYFARLQGRMHRLCGSEPVADEALLERCFEEEKASRDH